MQKFIAAAKTLSEELERLHIEEDNITTRTMKAAKRIRKTLTTFRKEISSNGFQNEADEIHFFKYVKPHVSAYLTFFSILAEIEEERMLAGTKGMTACIDKKHRWFGHVMRENREFVAYYRSGFTNMDRIYFLRGQNLSVLSKHNTRQQDDPDFNTSHDHVAATIMAFDLFQKHLIPKPELQTTFGPPKPKLKWTANKLDLVELIYALQASGAINYGEAELKEICAALEQAFQIKVGDLYRAFQDISNRKKEQIKFVNKLKYQLERKISELEGID
ncbi:RteC domain-containing protein [bacterium]|nr:RteC domain-containing protein [bacterium]